MVTLIETSQSPAKDRDLAVRQRKDFKLDITIGFYLQLRRKLRY